MRELELITCFRNLRLDNPCFKISVVAGSTYITPVLVIVSQYFTMISANRSFPVIDPYRYLYLYLKNKSLKTFVLQYWMLYTVTTVSTNKELNYTEHRIQAFIATVFFSDTNEFAPDLISSWYWITCLPLKDEIFLSISVTYKFYMNIFFLWKSLINGKPVIKLQLESYRNLRLSLRTF